MNLKTYQQFRDAGFRAADAKAAVKTIKRFERLSDLGLVRLKVEPDQECYDDSYIDTWTDVSEGRRKRIKKDLWADIETNGVWGMIGEYQMFGQWIHADSCWGFLGNDLGDENPYKLDIMNQTINAWRKWVQTRCRHCMGKGIR